MDTYFVDVILPLHIHDTYTYRVPQEYNDVVQVGQRVVVQFGSKRLYSAVVRRVHQSVPRYMVKYVLSILDVEPIVNEKQLRFWEWMAEYYMCYVGDVMAVALPSAFRLASESSVSIHPDFTGELSNLTENELRVVQLLAEYRVMTVDDIGKAIGLQKMMPILNTMVERGIIIVDEELRQRFVPRTSSYISFSPEYQDPASVKALFDSLEQKKNTQKQLDVLMKYIQMSQMGTLPVSKRALLSTTDSMQVSESALKTLLRHGVLQQEEKLESRLEQGVARDSADCISLNPEQQAAYDYLSHCEKTVSLLHGVTSSGKTEVYIKLMADAIGKGQQVLFLLPEIALTAQAINRLRRYFGDLVGVYHSRFSASQRAEVWNRTMTDDPNTRYQVLLGARSALFLPYRRLGLVIVDEEHDSSYKQYDPSPRYNGRDVAIYLAHLWGAKAVLFLSYAAYFLYLQKKEGKMLNPKASIVTLTYFGAEKTIEGYNAMGVAKAAWQSSIRYLAKDLGKDDIRINAISAGPIKTLSAKGIKYFNGILDVIEQRAPLHRNATAKEIGDVASFLFSDMSNAITGEVIHADNGFSTVAV